MYLFNFQIKTRNWLLEAPYRLLAHQMRVGKTAPTVIAAQIIPDQKVLVICPVIALSVWERHIKEWVKDAKRKKGFEVCSYDYARLHKKELLKQWDILILDESHYLKNPASKRTIAILGKEGIVQNCKKVWALTGTPMPNHPAELWTLLFVFGRTKLSYEDFIRYFCTYYIYKKKMCITGAKKSKIPKLKELLRPVMLRYTRKQVYPELPLEYYSIIMFDKKDLGKINIEKEVREKCLQEYQILKKALENIHKEEASFLALEAISQSVSTLRRIIGLRKVEPLAKIIEEELESKAYQKVVIFGIHIEVLENLFNRLEKFNPVIITGKSSSKQRISSILKFQKDPKTKIFIGNVLAAGMSIDLSVADEVVFIEKSWVPGDNAQASDRCAGINQKNKVHIRLVMTNYFLDSKVGEVLQRKSSEIFSVLN